MDKIKNPFSPGAGSPPPELAGRENILEHARVLLGRIKNKRSEKSLILTGLRGVGKTVLLNEIERIALAEKYKTILLEAHDGKSLAAILAPEMRKLLFDLDRLVGAGDKVKQGIAILKSFIGAIKLKIGDLDIGLDIEPAKGTADSGDLENDLSAIFIAVAEAAEERGVAVAILIDEIQYFKSKELSALIMAMHKMQQKQLPLVLIAAGLPILPGLIGESKSYAERLFSFPDIGPLSEDDSYMALQEPVSQSQVFFEVESLEEIYNITRGYPYFLQEWGYQAWNHADKTPIGLNVIHSIKEVIANRLDENFFRVRFERLTPSEKKFLRGMAELGCGPYRTGDVAQIFNTPIGNLSPIRASLIKKGMIYSPAHGDIAFTVPLFNEFMRRTIPDFSIEDIDQDDEV